MEAALYENLIRQIYHCGRNYSKGADADIYRALERAHRDLKVKSTYKSEEDREYEFRVRFSTVRNYVSAAIKDAIAEIKYTAPEDKIQNLTAMYNELDLSFYNKETLDDIIRNASEILRSQGMLAR